MKDAVPRKASRVDQVVTWQIKNQRALGRIALALLAIGVLWRCVRYLLQFPIWLDEAMLGLNFLHLDYLGLTRRLDNLQIAPILFLWGEVTACRWFGPTELSLRLLPFLAGIGSLVLFWRLTGLMLGPLARALAVGILAVAIWPVSMSTAIKPYSLDLFMSLAMLLLAIQWRQHPGQTWRLGLLTVLAPVALLASYPAVFIAGAVSLTLAWPVYQCGSWRAEALFVAYNLAVLAGFLGACWISANQLNTPVAAGTTRAGMEEYWARGFPPRSPLAFPVWLALAITGQITAYPLGAQSGGSILTVLMCGVGVWQWIKTRRYAWLFLFAAPFVLGLVAAAMHRYPFGTSCRLAQHVAPIVCILAGLGVAVLIDRPGWSDSRRWKWACAAFAILALVGLGGMIRDMVWPYRDATSLWVHRVMEDIERRVPASEPVVVCNTPQLDVDHLFNWYWTLQDRRVSWNCWLEEGQINNPSNELWGFYYGEGAAQALERLQAGLLQHDPSWMLVERIPFSRPAVSRKDRPERCELFRFVRSRTAERMTGSD